MVEITLDLLRRRAEHNNKELSTLEEITLHQFHITDISPLMGERCKRLSILFLQSNDIEVIRNLTKIRGLEYLNLAANRIRRLDDGLRGLDNLTKLDLTANYIYDFNDLITALHPLHSLRELYLTGCPLTDLPNYRLSIIKHLPQLTTLDATDITPTERVLALRVQPLPPLPRPTLPPITEDYELAREQERAARAKADAAAARPAPRPEPPVPTCEAEIRQTNRTGYEYHWDLVSWAEAGEFALYVDLPRDVPTAAVTVEAFPLYVDVRVQGHLLRLRLPYESKGTPKAARVGVTSALKITFTADDAAALALAARGAPASTKTVRRRRDWEMEGQEEDGVERGGDDSSSCSESMPDLI